MCMVPLTMGRATPSYTSCCELRLPKTRSNSKARVYDSARSAMQMPIPATGETTFLFSCTTTPLPSGGNQRPPCNRRWKCLVTFETPAVSLLASISSSIGGRKRQKTCTALRMRSSGGQRRVRTKLLTRIRFDDCVPPPENATLVICVCTPAH